jgi:hypothetical protein
MPKISGNCPAARCPNFARKIFSAPPPRAWKICLHCAPTRRAAKTRRHNLHATQDLRSNENARAAARGKKRRFRPQKTRAAPPRRSKHA